MNGLRQLGFAAGLALISLRLAAAPLNMTVSGESNERAELETLSPDPALPRLESLSLSIDGGKAALESEVAPLNSYQAALLSDVTKLPLGGLPAIPSSPFAVHAGPPEFRRDDIQRKEDRPMERRRSSPSKEEIASVSGLAWEYTIVDDQNRIWRRFAGEGKPEPLMWDGVNETGFVLNPNFVYNAFLVVRKPDGTARSFPGQGERFLAFSRRVDEDEWITFGSRLYKEGSASFAEGAAIYLDDAVNRISRLTTAGYVGNGPTPWLLTLHEPDEGLGRQRIATWKSFLEKSLDVKLRDEFFKWQSAETEQTRAELKLFGALPVDDSFMRGAVLPAPAHKDDVASWVRVSEIKDGLAVELRHDRLFRLGSAYLRDEALPPLEKALVRVKEEFKRGTKVVLRSYVEKTWNKKEEELAEDPKLAAMRAKVLFTLFAKERLLTR